MAGLSATGLMPAIMTYALILRAGEARHLSSRHLRGALAGHTLRLTRAYCCGWSVDRFFSPVPTRFGTHSELLGLVRQATGAEMLAELLVPEFQRIRDSISSSSSS
jgi:hypothetical protein